MKNFKGKYLKTSNGITLVALVVTIIVLLILAGVAIMTLTNDNGIISRTAEAKTKKEIAETQEELQLAIEALRIDNIANNVGGTISQYLASHEADLEKALNNEDVTIGTNEITYKNRKFTIDENGKITGSTAVVASSLPDTKKDDVYEEWTRLNNVSKTGGFDSTRGVNAPKLGTELTAVTATSDISDFDTNGIWYNYVAQTGTTDGKTSKWANAVLTDSNGKITGFYVWIPRFAYKITSGYHKSGSEINPSDGTQGAGTIEVAFLKGTTNEFADSNIKGTVVDTPSSVTYNATTGEQEQWLVHPAFTDNASIGGGFGSNGGITGLWVAKFEMSGFVDSATTATRNLGGVSGDAVITLCSLPSTPGSTGLSIGKTYNLSFNLNRNVDSHLLKNSEWGAVAYLAHSKFGRNGHEISFNNNPCTGGDSGYITNVNQSTTGNKYGIYDLSGNSAEFVAAYLDNSYVNDKESFTYGLGESLISAPAKYKNVYIVGTIDNYDGNSYDTNSGVKGDAVYETSNYKSDGSCSWFNAFALYPYAAAPFFSRDYTWNLWSSGGLFGFQGVQGGDHGFRVSLAI